MQKTILSSTKLIVKDLKAAAEFYHAVAGFAEQMRLQTRSGAWEILYKPREGEAGFVLMEYSDIPAAPQSNVVLVFTTTDARGFGERVLQAGGKVLHDAHPVTAPGYNLTILLAADLEGNVLEAVQMN
jgi:predicted enzyme related to lactoylglutathione lyase